MSEIQGSAAPATNQSSPATQDPNQAVGTGTTPAPVQGGETKSAAQDAMRKFKVKIDNQEQEVDESELIKGYTHGKAAAKRFQEGSRAKAQAEEFLKLMKNEGQLFDVIKQLGHDPRKLAENYLAAQIQDELMDPKDKELKTWKTKAEQYEAQENARRDEIKKQEHEKLKSKFAKEFTDTFIDALKTSGLPQTKPMVAEMAKYVKRAADIGYQLSPQDAAKLVKEDEVARLQGAVGETEGEVLANLLGEKTLQKLRAWETQRLKNPSDHLTTPEQPDQRRERSKMAARMTTAEWRAFNRSK